MILRPFKPHRKPIHSFSQSSPNHRQMTNIVKTKYRIRRIIRLKMWITSLSVQTNFIFIRINQIQFLILIQNFHYLIKRIFSQKIVVVEQSHKFAFSHIKSIIRNPRNMPIFFTMLYSDFFVLLVFLQNTQSLLIVRRIIHNTNFKIPITLRQY